MSLRERWGSRSAFVMAAIGSAVGLGNVWRYPYVVYKSGGGAFLIPFLVALLTAGIPLMILEYWLGQRAQAGAPQALKKIHKNFEWVGWWALSAALILTFYYAVVMSWCFNYLYYAFSFPEWSSNAKDFFFGKALQISSGPFDFGEFPYVAWPVVIGLAISWISVYLIICKGVARVGKVVLITVPLPAILLGILMVRGMTLEGAGEGLKFFLEPNFSALKDPTIWLSAYGQVFFSLSLGFGTLIAYASYTPKNSDITNNAFIVSLADCGISYMAGFAIFSTLGYLAFSQGLPVQDVVSKGPGLAFIVYPTALSLMPFGTLLAVVFFIMLLTLGIDSLFSMVEGVIAGIHDKWGFSKGKLVGLYCIFAFFMGLLFASKAGLYWLDIIDHFVTEYTLLLVGLFQCIAVGWFFNIKQTRKEINEQSDFSLGVWWELCIKYFAPFIITAILGSSIYKEIQKPYEGYPSAALGIGVAITVTAFLAGWLFASFKGKKHE